MRSTQEWEATLEEATPGPWKVLDDHPGEVGTADNRYWIAETYQEEIQYSEGDLKRAQADARLIASAPEVVAEVVRLRRGLEERIRVWQKVADKLEASGDTDVAEVMRHVGRSTAHILDGGDDE